MSRNKTLRKFIRVFFIIFILSKIQLTFHNNYLTNINIKDNIQTIQSTALSTNHDFIHQNKENLDTKTFSNSSINQSIYAHNFFTILVCVLFILKEIVLDIRQKIRYLITSYFSGSKYKGSSTPF